LNLREVRLRTSRAYELVLYDRLPDSERLLLQDLAKDPECYGVLRSREDPTLSLKSISRDMALLLYSLQEIGTLPRYAVESLGDQCVPVIGKMLLDGVLEIEVNGEMLSGPSAFELVCGTSTSRLQEGTLAAMSRRAIEYAALLQLQDAATISTRLYSYNTISLSRRWRAQLPDGHATAKFLGLLDGRAAQTLQRGWRPLPESPAWISWKAKMDGPARSAGSENTGSYKLYLSPACDRLRDAAEAIAETVMHCNATQWKVGKGVSGLLRPDKMVFYFREFADLQETASVLTKKLEGCAAQGVPFTAELAGGGLFSWGVDPPAESMTLRRMKHESWRVMICNRLALALVQAQRAASMTLSPAKFALGRLRLEGIDTDTWTPISATSQSQ
jgi:hypothetical protein